MASSDLNVGLNLYIDACVDYYYSHNPVGIITDAEYDQLAANLTKNYDKLPSWFKDLVAKEDFEGGGYVVGYNFGTGKWKKPS